MADRSLEIRITGDTSGFSSAMSKASGDLDGINKKMGGVSKAAVGFAAFEGAKKAAEFIGEATKAAAEDETAMARTGLAVKNAGESWAQLKDPIDKSLTSMSNSSGFMKKDLADAFSKLELRTKDHTKALQLEKLAMDASAQTGKPLAAVVMAVGKAYDGSSTALGRLGVVVPKVTAATDAMKKKWQEITAEHKGHLSPALKELEHTQLQNAAAADKHASSVEALDKAHTVFADGVKNRSETMAGKLAIFGAKWENIKVRIGDVILPLVVQGLGFAMQAFDTLSSAIDHNQTLFEVLAGILGGIAATLVIYEVSVKAVAVAQKVWAVATNIATAAQWLFNAAMDANPMVLVGIAIVALVAGLVLLYTHSATARAIIQGAFGAIKSAGEAAFGFLTHTVFPALQSAFGVLESVVKAVVAPLVGEFNAIKDGVVGAFKIVTDLLNGDFTKAWQDLVTMVSKVFGDILSAINNATGGLGTAALTAATGVVTSITGAISGIAGTVGGYIVGIGTSIGNAALGLETAATNTAKHIVTGAVTGVTGIATAVVNVVNNIPGAIAALADTFASGAETLAGHIITGAVKGVTGIATEVVNVVNNVPGAVAGLAGSFASSAETLAKHIITGAVAGVTGIASSIVNVVNNIPGAIAGLASSFYNAAYALGGQIAKGVLAALESLPGDVGSLIKKIPGASAVGGLLGKAGLAAGGWVNEPTLTWVGEQAPGYPEVVIPTAPQARTRALALLGQAQDALSLTPAATSQPRGSSGAVYVTIHQAPGETADTILQRLSYAVRRG